MVKAQDWRALLSYGIVLRFVPGNLSLILDTLAEVFPFPETESGDGYVIFSIWLREAVTAGLLTRVEEHRIRRVISNY